LSLSTPVTRLPSKRNALFGLSATLAAAGTGSVAATAASSPYVALRPLLTWRTTLFSVVSSAAGTFQVSAAAATSIARAVAPARRNASKFIGIEVEPPASCKPYSSWLMADWRVVSGGRGLQQGRLDDLVLAPREKKRATIPLAPIDPAPATEYFLEISFTLRNDTRWAHVGRNAVGANLENGPSRFHSSRARRRDSRRDRPVNRN